MNIKLVSVAAALAVSAAVAQDYDDEYEEEAPAAAESVQEEAPAAPAPEPAPAPAPAPAMNDGFESLTAQTAEAAPAPAGDGSLNVLHGNAYNQVGNEFAAATIGKVNVTLNPNMVTAGGDMGAIYKMSGRNLIYVDPTANYGALSLAKGSMTYLLAFDNSLGQGLATAGLAMGSFGVAVDFALDKSWNSTENKTPNTKATSSTATTRAGDLIQARIGAGLGAMDITAGVYWLTYQNEVDTENDNGQTPKTETDNDFWDLGANINLSNGPSAKSLAWSVGLNFVRQKSWTKSNEATGGISFVETTNNDAYIMFQPYFNFGLPVLQTAGAQVLLGLNTRVPVLIYDEIETPNGANNPVTTNNRNWFGVYTSPNILGEIALNENWIVFAEATYEWDVFDRQSSSTETGPNTSDNSTISMQTGNTSADAGVRFQYKQLSLEASIASNLNNQAWSGLVANLGAFLIF